MSILRNLVLTLFLVVVAQIGYAQYEPNGYEGTGALPIDVPAGVKDALSQAYGIPNVLIQNDYNMFFAPGTMLKYGTAYAEIWQGSPWGGATFRLPLGFKAALFMGRAYNGFIYNSFGTGTAAGNAMVTYNPLPTLNWVGFGTTASTASPFDFSLSPTFTPEHSFDVLVGRKLTSKMALGLKYSLFYNKKNDKVVIAAGTVPNADDGTMSNRKSYMEQNISLGLTLDDFWILNQCDVAVDMTLADLDFGYKESMVTNKGYADISYLSTGTPTFNFLLRPILKLSDTSRLIIMLDFYLKDTSTKYVEKIDRNDGGLTNHGVDTYLVKTFSDTAIGGMPLLALHTKPRDDLKIIYSAGLNLEKRTLLNTESTWGTNDKSVESVQSKVQMPISISLEYEVIEKLKLRLGFMKYLIDSRTITSTAIASRFQDESSTVENLSPQDSTTSFSTTLGAGYRWKDFEIDLSMSVKAYNFVTLFTGASIKYHY